MDLHKNIISSGINSSSQLNTIKKFLEMIEIKKTIFLIPNLNYDLEIKKGIKESKIKFFKLKFPFLNLTSISEKKCSI